MIIIIFFFIMKCINQIWIRKPQRLSHLPAPSVDLEATWGISSDRDLPYEIFRCRRPWPRSVQPYWRWSRPDATGDWGTACTRTPYGGEWSRGIDQLAQGSLRAYRQSESTDIARFDLLICSRRGCRTSWRTVGEPGHWPNKYFVNYFLLIFVLRHSTYLSEIKLILMY